MSVIRSLLRKHEIDWIWESTATAKDERQKACTPVNKGNVFSRKPWKQQHVRGPRWCSRWSENRTTYERVFVAQWLIYNYLCQFSYHFFCARYSEYHSTARETRRHFAFLKCDFIKCQHVVAIDQRFRREINRFAGTEEAPFDGYGDYDLRGFARHAGENGRRFSPHAVSRTQSRQTYLNVHTSAVARSCVAI